MTEPTPAPPKLPDLVTLLKSHFFTGVLVLIPFGVIAWILAIALGSLWQLQSWLPVSWQPSNLFEDQTLATLVSVVLTLSLALGLALLISLLGWVSQQYLGQKAIDAVAHIIQRIPVIRSIYSALDQLLKTLASGGGEQFSRVVYVEYPRRDCWALAFVTGPAKGPAAPPKHLNLFLPATPNMTSGFHLIVPESDVRESHMNVEEAFKTILSLGIAQPDSGDERSPPAGRS